MIPNPPHIQCLLRAWRDAPATATAPALARLFAAHMPHPTYAEFLRIYQLYLQSIPLPAAKAAWGLNQASRELISR